MPRSENRAIIVAGELASRQEKGIPLRYGVNASPAAATGSRWRSWPRTTTSCPRACQLGRDAEGRRDVAATVPGDEQDRAHDGLPSSAPAGRSAETSCLMRCSVSARDSPRSRRRSFQV